MNTTRPDGTTHVDPNSKTIPWYRLNKEGWSYWSEGSNTWIESFELESWHDGLTSLEQDLTTLDVPFGELDRDTQLRLVNHVLDGGECEGSFSSSDWVNYPECNTDSGVLCFYKIHKYRAVAKQVKQPTERETLEAKLHEQWAELNATMKRITEIK